jgi:hypothetical protein
VDILSQYFSGCQTCILSQCGHLEPIFFWLSDMHLEPMWTSGANIFSAENVWCQIIPKTLCQSIRGQSGNLKNAAIIIELGS